ncbi:MAG: NHLP leader peptide family RiPP precursor [Actinomycetota bacterium]
MAVPSRSEVEAIIAERIAADPGFREALLANPHAVLSEVVGFDIPDSVQVVLHEESLTQIHLVMPAPEALTDTDLELVAGAGWPPTGGESSPGQSPSCGCK